MAICEKCRKTNREVLLCNVISREGIVKMCEPCARLEGLPIAKMPSDSDAINFVIAREPKPPKLQTIQDNNLIDKFSWHLQMARRGSGLTIKQLAQKLGEPEEAITSLETGKFLQKLESDRVIGKIEQFFRIKLKKDNDFIGSDIELVDDVFSEKE